VCLYAISIVLSVFGGVSVAVEMFYGSRPDTMEVLQATFLVSIWLAALAFAMGSALGREADAAERRTVIWAGISMSAGSILLAAAMFIRYVTLHYGPESWRNEAGGLGRSLCAALALLCYEPGLLIFLVGVLALLNAMRSWLLKNPPAAR
jgi:hypothetical protein